MDRTSNMITDESIIAYAVDPRFRGVKLDSEQLEVVTKYFEENDDLNAGWRLFKAKLGNLISIHYKH